MNLEYIKLVTKRQCCMIPLYEVTGVVKFIETEGRGVVAGGGGNGKLLLLGHLGLNCVPSKSIC